ncbi:MAG: hypothetical protein HC911_05830 [Chloroflexaceae bacterium]|nr:hypothetical protein [Chloroflexaceae bacterium]
MSDTVFVLNPDHRAVAHGQQPYILDGAGVSVLSLIAPLFLLVGILISSALIPLTRQAWHEYDTLMAEMQSGTAQVLDKRISYDDEGDASYFVSYIFSHPLPNGEPYQYEATASVSRSQYEQLEYGQQLPIVFAPSDPTISRLNPPHIAEPILATIFTFVWLVGWNGVAGYFSYRTVRDWLGQRALRRGQLLYGTLTKITGVAESTLNYKITVDYTFTAPDGTPISDNASHYNSYRPATPLPPVGTRVAIWYGNRRTYRLL